MKFTIGIPAYKSLFLKECIDSILAQTYADFELIIINDASPENIDEIVHSYNDHRISYYKNEKNFGAVNVVDNWNKCLSNANGDYFVLMGDDDKMKAEYLQEFSDLIEKYPNCGVYHCRAVIIDENSNPIQLTGPRPEFESVYDSILERMKGNRLFFISDYVYNTNRLKKDGGFYKLPLAWASDDISAFIAAKEHGIAHTNVPVFLYRRNAQTISTTGNIYLKMDAILGEEKWFKEFLKTDAEHPIDQIIKENIQAELKLFIQKKKIRTIYADVSANIFMSFFKWLKVRKQYQLSVSELVYATLLRIKESKKLKYG